jgi:Lipoxygenase
METTLESVIDIRERAARDGAAGFTPERLANERSLAVNRERYKWQHIPGMPPFSKHNPEVAELRAEGRLGYDYSMSVLNGVFSGIAWTLDKSKRANRLSQYSRAYALRQKPDVATRWRTDAEFARQRLNGVNPLLLQRITQIPEKFAVTEEHVRYVLPGGVTLRSLLAEGRLFLCDWVELEQCPVAFGRFLSAPLALFWLDRNRQLMPLAIQLAQSIQDAKVVFTPSDEPWLWLTARTHVQAADAALHEIVAHLFRTHLTMETVFVAMCRTLPPQHPVHQFLAPHFEGTIYVNRGARETMIAPGGPIDEAIAVGTDGAYWLIAKAWETFSFTDLDPRENLQRRGVQSAEDLPGYYYRDDALLLWDAIGRYTENVLRHFYTDDAEVARDECLAHWFMELTTAEGGGISGIPGSDGNFRTFDNLHRMVRITMFTATCEHSAVNNGQYDIFGFIPNAPGAMYLPPPTTFDISSEGMFTYGLPPFKAVATQLKLVHLLSTPPMSRLGQYPAEFLREHQEVRRMVDRFLVDLDDIAFAIESRNARVPVPYTYLQPESIANSVSV